MAQNESKTDLYFKQFELAELDWKSHPSWINKRRQEAMARFREMGFPTIKQEEWRQTNVSSLVNTPFGRNGFNVRLSGRQIDNFTLETPFSSVFVFVNGHHRPELSKQGAFEKEIKIMSLTEAIKEKPDLLEGCLSHYADFREDAFTALNTAFMEDGAFIYLPKGAKAHGPIHLLFISTAPDKAIATYPRNLILAEENTQASIIEHYVGLEADVYFTNTVTEIVSGNNSSIEHYKVQEESLNAFHISTLKIHQSDSSHVTSHNISLGAALSRHNIHSLLDAEGCGCTLNGLYLGEKTQHVDCHTVVEHLKPHGTSKELYKGILNDKARGIFNGKVIIHKEARQSNAQQTNKNLLLSEWAEADPKPQLEIYNNDVKATHGATVGQLDKNQLFYLQSRGIGFEAAKSLLTYAFASEILCLIKVDPIQERLREALLRRLPEAPVLKEMSPETPILREES